MNEQNLQVAKNILKVNKKTLKSMHDIFGIDFEKELTIKEIELPKTLKKIVQENNITDETTNYLLIQQRDWRNEIELVFNVVIFDADSKFRIDGFATNYRGGIDSFFRKSDFNSVRKDKNLKAFLIIVPKEFNNISNKLNEWRGYSYKEEKTKEIEQEYKKDINCFYRIKYNKENVRRAYCGGNIQSVYAFQEVKIDNFQLDYACIEYDYWQFRNNEKQEHDLIDKSGYNIYAKRHSLNEKLRLIKENRNKKAIIKTDFVSLNCELLQEFNRVRNLFAEKLLKTDMFTDEFGIIIRKLEDIAWITRDYKNHERKLNDIKSGAGKIPNWNKYNTVDEIKNTIKEIMDKLHRIETTGD